MKKNQILGTGCTTCKKLTDMAEAAAQSLGAPYEIERSPKSPASWASDYTQSINEQDYF